MIEQEIEQSKSRQTEISAIKKAESRHLAEARRILGLGEPVSELSEDEMRAYGWVLKRELRIPNAHKQFEFIKRCAAEGAEESGDLPLALSTNSVRELRVETARSAVRNTISGVGERLMSVGRPLPDYFIRALAKEPELSPIAISSHETVVFDGRK